MIDATRSLEVAERRICRKFRAATDFWAEIAERVYPGDMDPGLSTLAEVYLRHHATHNDEDFWACEEVQKRVRADLAQAWAITQALVEKADAGPALGYVAAGPLEDLVDGYGNAALDIIEAKCETDQKMQLALSGIWLERESPVLMRWRDLMQKYGFVGGPRQSLSTHPDCWF